MENNIKIVKVHTLSMYLYKINDESETYTIKNGQVVKHWEIRHV